MRSHALRILAAVFLVLLVASPVAAQTEPGVPAVTYVDATEPVVDMAVIAETYDLSEADIRIQQRGEQLEIADLSTAVANGWPVELVFVIDVDNRNAAGGALNSMARAARDLAASLPDGSQVGLVSAGRRSNIEVPLTTSLARFNQGLDELGVDQGAALIDATTSAAKLFGDDGQDGSQRVVRSVIVLAGGPDTASTGGVSQASAALVQNLTQLVLVNINGTTPGMTNLTSVAGGAVVSRGSDEEIASAVNRGAAIAADRLLLSFRPIPVEDDAIDAERAILKVTIGNQTRSISFPRGMETTNILQLAPLPEVETSRFAFLGKPIVLYISIALAFACVATGVWALASMFIGGDSHLDRILARYAEGKDIDEEEAREMLVQTELLQRAVDFTEGFARRRGFLSRVEDLLERADLPVRPGEAMFFLVLIVALVTVLVTVVTSSLLVGLFIGIASAFATYGVVVFLAQRRLKTFEGQLPDTLQLLAGTLRAGYSLPQGIDAVSNEIADPMGEELRRAVTETQLGRELEESLAMVAERLHSDDFSWTVMAIGIQREVGGNLNELLMTVADTMVQRERLKREVAALTAEGRVSALILSLLPPGLGAVLFVMNPDYVGVLFEETLGLILLGVAVTAGVIGLLWMKKVITIDA